MSTAMDKPLDGAGLAVVNQIFNERLGQLESGGGGVDWAETPFTGMTHFNNSSAFGCAWLETEKISSMARIIRGVGRPPGEGGELVRQPDLKSQPAGRVSGADLQGRLRDRRPDSGNGDGQADHDQRRDLGVLRPQPGQSRPGWRVLYRVRVRNGGRMKEGTALLCKGGYHARKLQP